MVEMNTVCRIVIIFVPEINELAQLYIELRQDILNRLGRKFRIENSVKWI